MAYSLFAILLTLPAIYARIEIDITTSPNDDERQVAFQGSNIDVISEKERNSFHLEDSQFKKAVGAYFGIMPSYAYLRNPTPWGDLYQTKNWTQVTRTLTPQRATILSFDSAPIVLSSQFLQTTSLSALDVGHIKYGFRFKNDVGQTNFSYISNWGESASQSKEISVGLNSDFEILLQPNKKVIAEVWVSKSIMEVQVDYEASLSGSIAVKYDGAYNGSSIWHNMDVNEVMRAAGLETTMKSSEVIKLVYYSDAEVVMREVNTDN